MSHAITLPRSTPEAQGLSSAVLLTIVDQLDTRLDSLHSLMVLRHGHVVTEGWWAPYRPDLRHMLFSLSKSFTSTAAGLAFAEGRLSPDDLVLGFFPAEAPAKVSEHVAAMRVRHLLSMSTGHGEDTLTHLMRQQEGDWARAFLDRPVEFEPGTHFLYNSGATYLVSAILQKLTGQPVVDYLAPRLFGPLGIVDPVWESCPRGINTGGWGLSLRTEDIAKFGQLYLQDGLWQGARLLPAGWVAEATRSHIDNSPGRAGDWAEGYGYQFWRCQHGHYRGDGAFGQYCVVLPEFDTVIATTAGLGDMQLVLDIFWEHLLPALQSAPLPADSGAVAALGERLAGLRLRPPEGAVTAPAAAAAQGRRYDLEPNAPGLTALRFDFDTGRLTAESARGETHLPWGRGGGWVGGETTWDSAEPQRVAGSGAWTDERTFALKLCYPETPFCPVLTCRFEGDRVTVDSRANVSFFTLDQPTLVGTSRA